MAMRIAPVLFEKQEGIQPIQKTAVGALERRTEPIMLGSGEADDDKNDAPREESRAKQRDRNRNRLRPSSNPPSMDRHDEGAGQQARDSSEQQAIAKKAQCFPTPLRA